VLRCSPLHHGPTPGPPQALISGSLASGEPEPKRFRCRRYPLAAGVAHVTRVASPTRRLRASPRSPCKLRASSRRFQPEPPHMLRDALATAPTARRPAPVPHPPCPRRSCSLIFRPTLTCISSSSVYVPSSTWPGGVVLPRCLSVRLAHPRGRGSRVSRVRPRLLDPTPLRPRRGRSGEIGMSRRASDVICPSHLFYPR